MEVDARFHCTDKRTIVMTIVAGQGRDSVVETHATPIDGQTTAIVEATCATWEGASFHVLRRLNFLMRPMLARAALRLWKDDAAYAERLAYLEQREQQRTTITRPEQRRQVRGG